MKEIPLSKNYTALIDDEDYKKVARHKWTVQMYKRTDGSLLVYAIRRSPPRMRMHRFILGLSDPKIQIDHRDRNGLNNQKHNLRIATASQNQYNTTVRSDNISGFKGVYWNRERKRWAARIRYERKRIFLGYFYSVEEAAKAYSKAAKRYHGKFAASI